MAVGGIDRGRRADRRSPEGRHTRCRRIADVLSWMRTGAHIRGSAAATVFRRNPAGRPDARAPVKIRAPRPSTGAPPSARTSPSPSDRTAPCVSDLSTDGCSREGTGPPALFGPLPDPVNLSVTLRRRGDLLTVYSLLEVESQPPSPSTSSRAPARRAPGAAAPGVFAPGSPVLSSASPRRRSPVASRRIFLW
jgi:hypothetical protein